MYKFKMFPNTNHIKVAKEKGVEQLLCDLDSGHEPLLKTCLLEHISYRRKMIMQVCC